MRIYFDNCCYNRPFDDQSQLRIALETQAKLFIQQRIEQKDIELVYSYLTLLEIAKNPHIEHRESIERFLKNAVLFVGTKKSEIVRVRANEIMLRKIKANDAIHLSCAIEGKCNCFITTDDGILKNYVSNEIHICSPIDFLKIWEKNQ